MIAIQRDLYTLGSAAAQTQHTVREVQAAARRLGISPELAIDGIPHFAARDVERIAAHFREQDAAK